MRISVDINSWLSLAPLLDFTNADGTVTTFWDTPNLPVIVPQDSDTFVDVDDGYVGLLDLVAFDKYGDVNLWWAIALANNLDLLPSSVVLGLRLRIPNKTYLMRLISAGAS